MAGRRFKQYHKVQVIQYYSKVTYHRENDKFSFTSSKIDVVNKIPGYQNK